jgi:pilus assembly protein CpaB
MKPARLIVLFIAIAAGGIAALLAGRSDQPPPPPSMPAPVAQLETTDVLVANTDIGMGNSVGEKELRWQTWPAEAAGASANFIRKSDRPDAIGQLIGSIARVAFSQGEPIREAKLIRANGSGYMAAILPTGMRAVSIDISPERGVSGFVLPNDHVDVILTRHDKEAEKNNGGTEVLISETIMTDVRVLAIGKTVEEKAGEHTIDGTVATLELAPAEAERLSLARQRGTLSLSLRSLVDSGRQGPVRHNEAIVVYRGADSETLVCAPNCDHSYAAGGTSSSSPSNAGKSDQAQAPGKPSPK